MTSPHTLLVTHAHPDDEVFGTGGILAKYAEAGARVVVVYCTRGEAGEIHDPDLDPAEAAIRLGEIREQEVREAALLLGVQEIHFLGYRDSGMIDTDDNKNPDAFMNAPLDEAAGLVLDIMRDIECDVVVTYDEEGGYGHPDHVMCNRVTVEAFKRARRQPWAPKKLYYSARSREAFRLQVEHLAAHGLKYPWVNDDFNFDEYGTPEAHITAHIDISHFVGLKKQALAIHRTQIPSDFFYLSIPDDALAAGAGTEFFLRVIPPSEPGEHEADLFAGLDQHWNATPTAEAGSTIPGH
ncbi:MAG: PIG-L family deacetylase [Chloroflexota bacterium]